MKWAQEYKGEKNNITRLSEFVTVWRTGQREVGAKEAEDGDRRWRATLAH